jgi:hypothetical protein
VAVWCRQQADGTPDQVHRIEPHYPGQPDAELLERKREGAKAKGWTVRRSGAGFVARKVRWGGVDCIRTFWVD